jgi:hypothetical protein
MHTSRQSASWSTVCQGVSVPPQSKITACTVMAGILMRGQGSDLTPISAGDPARATKDQAVKYLALVDATLFAIGLHRDEAAGRQPHMA